MFRITNRNGFIVWEGKAWSFYDAWQQMFEACGYPYNARIITDEINRGMWIEKISEVNQ